MPARQSLALPVVSTPEDYGPDLPTRADLDAATAATQTAIDSRAPAADVIAAAEAEEAVLLAYALRPGAEAELQAGI
jgi:creatinine amidohydrolase/Fe(II)-dependent formamide hydrolase-like protein